MKINKIILRISHFFGFRKGEQHIDDVTVNIPSDNWGETKHTDITLNDKETEDDINDIKSQILNAFDNDPKLEERCAIASQVWITFYKSTDVNKRGSRMKMLYYNKDKTLYYPCDSDRKRWKRDQKIESII